MIKETEIFNCSCGDLSHMFRVTIDKDEPLEDYLFFEFNLNQDIPIYRRAWNSIKYVFGGDETLKDFVLSEKEAKKFYNQLHRHLNTKGNNGKSTAGNRKKSSKRKMR